MNIDRQLERDMILGLVFIMLSILAQAIYDIVITWAAQYIPFVSHEIAIMIAAFVTVAIFYLILQPLLKDYNKSKPAGPMEPSPVRQ
ncbi:MAG: hypothetical protein JRN53_07130 [Nitrososphaerota archaeon]|nr:hypothetical protein [Nitrososphaerota archaeon]